MSPTPFDWKAMRVFLVLWAGQLVSVIGSGLSRFALGLWVYDQTGSVTQFALISLSSSLPIVLLSPFAGALADRWDRRRALLLANMVSAAIALGVALLLATGRLEVWHIYLAMTLKAVPDSFHWPAFSASITLLVPKAQLVRAAGMMQTANATAQVVAPLLASQLIGWVGTLGVVMIDFASFGATILALALVRIPTPPKRAATTVKPGLLVEIREGWRFVSERPGLVRLLLFFTTINTFYALATVLYTPLILGFAGPTVLGATLSTGALGLLGGSLLMAAWGGPERRVHGVLSAGVLLGFCMALAGLRPSVPLVTASLVGLGLAIPLVNGCSQGIWQTKVAPALQGRVFAIRRMFATCSAPAGHLLAGPLADRLFEPWLQVGGPLAGSVGAVVGVGTGRGIGFLLVVLGLICAGISLQGFTSKRLRHLEAEVPDALEAKPATS